MSGGPIEQDRFGSPGKDMVDSVRTFVDTRPPSSDFGSASTATRQFSRNVTPYLDSAPNSSELATGFTSQESGLMMGCTPKESGFIQGSTSQAMVLGPNPTLFTKESIVAETSVDDLSTLRTYAEWTSSSSDFDSTSCASRPFSRRVTPSPDSGLVGGGHSPSMDSGLAMGFAPSRAEAAGAAQGHLQVTPPMDPITLTQKSTAAVQRGLVSFGDISCLGTYADSTASSHDFDSVSSTSRPLSRRVTPNHDSGPTGEGNSPSKDSDLAIGFISQEPDLSMGFMPYSVAEAKSPARSCMQPPPGLNPTFFMHESIVPALGDLASFGGTSRFGANTDSHTAGSHFGSSSVSYLTGGSFEGGYPSTAADAIMGFKFEDSDRMTGASQEHLLAMGYTAQEASEDARHAPMKIPFDLSDLEFTTQMKESPASILRGVTTVMLKFVPVKYTQRRLLREILGAGFQGKVDFFYLPMEPRKCQANRGFAFCNLANAQAAELFYSAFHGSHLKAFESDQVLEVSAAEVQGFEANAALYLKSQAKKPARSSKSRPIFLRTLPQYLQQLYAQQSEESSQKAACGDNRHRFKGKGKEAAPVPIGKVMGACCQAEKSRNVRTLCL
eukprot:TRINITY_DN7301_c0_g1_i5.p1 TRINITY_DN7301_c0_g1~~TRINITY_DN7301_c0_g1_i5.p1  ORF type:complete len:679 (-),score=99.75 TRINITY_DN7301_c0_g1_i5:90-1925(-)